MFRVVVLLESVAVLVETSIRRGLHLKNEDLVTYFLGNNTMHVTEIPEYINNMRHNHNAT